MVALSVIIPLFNEENRIIRTLEKIENYLSKKKKSFEVILVDDGSTDGTLEVISKFIKKDKSFKILKLGANEGKGWAIRKGVLASTGENVLFTDADLATPIEEEAKLQEELDKGFDIAIASRIDKNGKDQRSSSQPRRRRVLGKFFNLLVSSFVLNGFKDTQCGFKMFTAKAAREIFREQKIKRIGFDVELLFLAKRRGMKIAEVPVQWKGGKESRMNVFRELGVLKDILWIRFIH